MENIKKIIITSENGRCYATLDGTDLKCSGATADFALGLLAVKSSIVLLEDLCSHQEGGRWVVSLLEKRAKGQGTQRVEAIGDLIRNNRGDLECIVVTM